MFDEFYLKAVIIAFLATFAPRFLPYLLFKKQARNDNLSFIQENMPLIIMVVLVFYCFLSFDFKTFPYAIDMLCACILVLILQLIFKNALISIFVSTLFYMIISRLV